MINEITYIHIGILFSHKTNEILPFVTTWTDFKGLTLDQITQKERQIPQDLSYM